jgi:hypothetical protein
MPPDAAAASILSTPPTPAPAAPAAAPAPAPGGTPPAAVAPWFPDTHKGFMESKGNPDAATFVESYINLEKLVGADPKTILRMPKDGDAESTAKFYTALGRPEKPEGYTKIDALKDDPLDAAMTPIAHELGLTDKQWSGLRTKLIEHTVALNKTNGEVFAGEFAAQQKKRMEALTLEVGAEKMPQFVEDARRAVRTAIPDTYKDPATGTILTREEINTEIEGALGRDLSLRIFSTLGKFQAEDKTITGAQPASGIMTPEAAQDRWNVLQKDEGWRKRYIAGGVDERREADRIAEILASAKVAA